MKNFDAPVHDVVVADEDRQFEVGGQVFKIRRRLRAGLLEEILHLNEGTTGDKVRGFREAMEQLIVKSDHERWNSALEDDDDDTLISFDQMSEILNWALETVSDRPLENAESSSDSSTTTEQPSREPISSLAAVPSID